MRCPNCKNKLLQKSGDSIRLRTEGVHQFDDSGVCKAKCYWCKSEVTVPIQLQEDVEVEKETFILRKGKVS